MNNNGKDQGGLNGNQSQMEQLLMPIRGLFGDDTAIDETAIAIGEMREFMTHHRQQMEGVNNKLFEHSIALEEAHARQQHFNEVQEQTLEQIKDVQKSVNKLCDTQSKKKHGKRNILIGFGGGVLAMTVFAAIYYQDSELLQIVYRHTIGLIL